MKSNEGKMYSSVYSRPDTAGKRDNVLYCWLTISRLQIKTSIQTSPLLLLNSLLPPDMARVYNWDVKRRSKENLLKSADKS